jgi:hypothetical protein
MSATEQPGIASQAVAVTPQPHGGSLSEILRALAADPARERISVSDLVEVMRFRAFGALMFIFAVPNVLPAPPGISSLLGAPLLFLTAQLALRRRTPWLPKLIADRSMSRAQFASLIGRAIPWLARAERLLQPRLSFLTRPPFEQAIGVCCLLLAVILFLPVPLGNMAPAFAICLLSLAMLERDGLVALLGLVVGVGSAVLVSGIAYAVIQAGIFVVLKAVNLL